MVVVRGQDAIPTRPPSRLQDTHFRDAPLLCLAAQQVPVFPVRTKAEGSCMPEKAAVLPYMVTSAPFGKLAQGRNVSGTARSACTLRAALISCAGRPTRPEQEAGRRAVLLRERSRNSFSPCFLCCCNRYSACAQIIRRKHYPRGSYEFRDPPSKIAPSPPSEMLWLTARKVESVMALQYPKVDFKISDGLIVTLLPQSLTPCKSGSAYVLRSRSETQRRRLI